MKPHLSHLLLSLLIAAAAALILFGKRPTDFRLPDGRPVHNRVIVTFWEKWTRHEAAAMQEVVNRFNLSQDRIFVNLVSMSQVNQKMLIATAGGDPPDICGLWAAQVTPYIMDGAIEPLDELVENNAAGEGVYKPYIWRICAPQGRLYACSATPVTMGIYWNKKHFREAGLDPDTPPRTVEELDAIAEKLTRRDGSGEVVRYGFLPNEPGWWDYSWGMYWGNTIYDPIAQRYNIDTPAQREAFTWFQSYARRFGAQEVLTFKSGVQDFNSPTNAFISGRVSIVVQGPFFSEFIRRNDPSLEWAAAAVPLPAKSPLKAGDVALGDLDVWVIPRGARHRKEALEVLTFFSRQDNIEYLSQAHAKPSPRRIVSEEFLRTHPNPYIRVFESLAMAKDVHILPQSPVWERCRGEIDQMVLRIWKGADVAAELRAVQGICDKYLAEYQTYAARRAQLEPKRK